MSPLFFFFFFFLESITVRLGVQNPMWHFWYVHSELDKYNHFSFSYHHHQLVEPCSLSTAAGLHIEQPTLALLPTYIVFPSQFDFPLPFPTIS